MPSPFILLLLATLGWADVGGHDPATWKFDTEVLQELQREYATHLERVRRQAQDGIDEACAAYRAALESEREQLQSETSKMAEAAAQIRAIGVTLASLEDVGPGFLPSLVGRSWIDAEHRWTMVSGQQVVIEPRRNTGVGTRFTADIEPLGNATFCCRFTKGEPYRARGGFFVFQVDRRNNVILRYQLRVATTESHPLRLAPSPSGRLKKAEKAYWKAIDKEVGSFRQESAKALKVLYDDLDLAREQQAGGIEPEVMTELQIARSRVKQLTPSNSGPGGKHLARSLVNTAWVETERPDRSWTFELDGRRRLCRYREGEGPPGTGGWEVLDNTVALVWLQGIFAINVNLGGSPPWGEVVGADGSQGAPRYDVRLTRR